MDDKGGLALTPSSALRDEVSQRVLAMWQQVRQGSSELQDLRKVVIDGKSQGVDFLGDDGSQVLGPELSESPALRGEFEAADRAFFRANDALSADDAHSKKATAAISGLLAREGSNPYAPAALDRVSGASSELADQIRVVRGRRDAERAANEGLLPAETVAISLGRSQVRAAVLSKDRVGEERAKLTAALSEVFTSPDHVLNALERRAFEQEAHASDLGQELRRNPEQFGEMRSFRSGFLQREDQTRKGIALAGVARACSDFIGTVHFYTGELRNSELEIAEQQASGIPALSRDLTNLLDQTPPGSNLFSGITQEDRRDRLISEARTLASQIGQRVDGRGAKGLTSQLTARLRNVQARLKSAVTIDRARTQELKQRRDGSELSF